MRRAAISICSNLAEGGFRVNKGELKQFVGIARGSAGELKYQIVFAKDFAYITQEIFLELTKEIERIHKMLTGLIRSLEQ